MVKGRLHPDASMATRLNDAGFFEDRNTAVESSVKNRLLRRARVAVRAICR
jgi:hypothetical protein